MVAGMYADDMRARIEPFVEIELDLGPWWPPPPPGGAAEAPVSWTTGSAR
jgi:hypothetical protein